MSTDTTANMYAMVGSLHPPHVSQPGMPLSALDHIPDTKKLRTRLEQTRSLVLRLHRAVAIASSVKEGASQFVDDMCRDGIVPTGLFGYLFESGKSKLVSLGYLNACLCFLTDVDTKQRLLDTIRDSIDGGRSDEELEMDIAVHLESFVSLPLRVFFFLMKTQR